MENVPLHIALFSLVLFVGVALNRFSKFFKMPILICFLAVGVICGKYGLDLFPAMELEKVQLSGEFALAFIIFAGGLGTSAKAIRSVFVTGTILATVGVLLTAGIVGVMIYFLSNSISLFPSSPLLMCLLVGAVISSTDAAAVFAILRGQKAAISPRLQSLLEYESGSNDPAAFLLTSILIQVVQSNAAINVAGIGWNVVWGIIWGLGAGAAAGFLVGVAGQWFYNWIHSFLEYDGLRVVVAVAIVLFCAGVTEAVFHANVLMACYVAGITMGNLRFNYKHTFTSVHDGVSWLMQIILFTSLGCFFDYRMLFNYRNMLGAILLAVSLMFIARPLAVLLCMIRSPFNMKERIFTSWVGIRGSAPIMLAAMVVAAFPPETGVPTNKMFYVIFTVVLLSILLQGSSIMWVAKKLGLMLPYQEEAEKLLEYNERSDGREMVQFMVGRDSEFIGTPAKRPDTVGESIILLMIRRGNQLYQPTSAVKMQEGDLLCFLGTHEDIVDMHRRFFPNEKYTSLPTFKQISNHLMKKISSRRGKKPRKA